MLDTTKMKRISGTFVSPLLGDTGINNWGLKEWEDEYILMKQLGFDTIVVIRSEVEQGGQYRSALDPRGTTWEEDPNLLSMFFRLSEKYGMKLFLGGTISITNLHLGEWQKEIDNNERFYEKMLKMFGGYKCFEGLYLTIEALPWHFNFFDIATGVLDAMKRIAPEKKTLFSPTIAPLTGNMNSIYKLDDFKRIYAPHFEKLGEKLDYCAWQDKFFAPECRMGEIIDGELVEWYGAIKEIMDASGIELWANIESFQRKSVNPEPSDFRQIDYRSLAMKIASASPFAEKLITFEFSTCMSPNAEWGSSGRLLRRYIEMTGIEGDFKF